MMIIGAGFSRPAGLPLGNELFPEIRRRAKRLEATVLDYDVERYLTFVERTTGRKLTPDEIDFERFMSYLDIEHSLRLTGSDTWTNQGNESQNLVRTIIAEILLVAQRAMSGDAKRLYDQFVRRLDPNEYILTFNYDTIIEDALDRQGIPYRLVPSRHEKREDGGLGFDLRASELALPPNPTVGKIPRSSHHSHRLALRRSTFKRCCCSAS
jgi:hypothetical protein